MKRKTISKKLPRPMSDSFDMDVERTSTQHREANDNADGPARTDSQKVSTSGGQMKKKVTASAAGAASGAVRAESAAADIRMKAEAKARKHLASKMASEKRSRSEAGRTAAEVRKKRANTAEGGGVEKTQLDRKIKWCPPTVSADDGKARVPDYAAFKLPKAGQIVQLANRDHVSVWGLQSQSGERYALFRQGSRSALIPLSAWHGGSGEATKLLLARGMIVVLDMPELRKAVGVLRRWTIVPTAPAPGWTGQVFATGNAVAYGPSKLGEPFLAFVPDAVSISTGGTRANWMQDVAEPLANHLLASFFMMAMFAGPLLQLIGRTTNFGFEIAGPAGRGKSTLQLLMASVAGPAIGSAGTTYWRSLNTTVNALEAVVPMYNDLTLILDEAGGLPDSGKADERARIMRELAFRLAGGRGKERLGYAPGSVGRIIYVVSTNRSVASLVSDGHSAEAEAISDRLITIPVLEERAFGIFDNLPKGYGSTGAFAEALKRGATDNYGCALPTYLRYLVDVRGKSPQRLANWVRHRIARFVRRCGADANDGSQLRVAEAFGLVEAAGYLAKRAGALPRTYQTTKAALACYHLHYEHGRPPRSIADRLRALIRDARTVDVSKVKSPSKAARLIANARVILHTTPSGERELLVPAKWGKHVFPDLNRLRKDADMRARLRAPEGDRNVVDRVLAGKRTSVYCFDISDLEN